MKNFIRAFICLSIIGNFALNAQESVDSKESYYPESGKISGVIKDSEKGTPLEADIRLFTGDTVFIKGTKCDSSGGFKLENIPFGTYKLEASIMEYSSLTVDKIKLDVSSPHKSFDTLTLKKQNVTTEEILVEEQKGLLSLVGDKKVFNVNKSIITKGGTALDVLKKVPMVDVDMEDNVSLRGSKNVRILIDDKPPKFASLKQIPADAIEKVEVITNPSAKYEAEGVTGIINLVMKADKKLGFNGNANLGTGYRDLYWGGGNINFKKKKWTFFGNSFLGMATNYRFDRKNNLSYLNPVSYLQSDGRGTAMTRYVFVQGGVENEFIKSNNIGVEFNYNKGRWTNDYLSNTGNLDSLSKLVSFFTRKNLLEGTWEGLTGSLYYSGKLNEEGRELSGDITFTENKSNNIFDLTRHDYDGNMVPVTNNPYRQKDEYSYKFFNLNAQLDYVHPFNKTTRLETGYKGTFRRNDNTFDSDTLDNGSNIYIRNLDISNHFKLNENINAVYCVFSSSVEQLSYKAGLRLEHSITDGELFTGGYNFRKNSFDYFPTLNLAYKIGDEHQVQASYSRRITRPGIWRLNPFINKSDPRMWRVGNPDLDPEYTDSYELSYSFFHKIISVTPMLFFRQSHNVISSYSYLNNDNVLISTFMNASGSKAYGLDLVIGSRALPWLNLNGTLSMYNTKFDKDPVTENAQEEGFSWKGNLRANFNFNDLFNLELYYNYVGKIINAQGENLPSQNIDAGISKTFFGFATVSLRASDIFKTMKWTQNVNTSGYIGSYISNYDSRAVHLDISLTFGNTSDNYAKSKKERRNANERNDQNQDNNNLGR